MKTPLVPTSRGRGHRHSDGERGVTIALVAIAMVSIIGVAMLAIDLVTLFLAREEAQRSADTAALAAARVISLSGITGTANTSTDNLQWQLVCGGSSSLATQAALATAGQNSVSSTSADTVHVYYAVGTNVLSSTNTDCSTLTGQAPAINPVVVVTVTRNHLPTFFSRYFGYGGQSVTSTAVAEVFNPSASENAGTSGAVTPVQPRCVKPWIVPNSDPVNGGTFVSTGDGSITTPAITTNGAAGGVIGETFHLGADCQSSQPSACVPYSTDPVPKANSSNIVVPGGGFTLEYLPGLVSSPPVAVPSCATTGTGLGANYIQAVGGCDQSTNYQCGQPLSAGNSPSVDLTENPGTAGGDTAVGLACVATNQSAPPMAGQDTLVTTTYPFQILTGSANPLRIPANTQVTTSNQIVSLPIFDPTGKTGFTGSGTGAQFAVVGFLQVFVDGIDVNGNVQVTVLNVAGCGDAGGTNNPVTGSSPVPIRLITPP